MAFAFPLAASPSAKRTEHGAPGFEYLPGMCKEITSGICHTFVMIFFYQ